MAFFAKPQSTAVKIVDPNTQDESKSQTRKDSVQRQCRNVLIYGFCKYENKGCVFSHPTTESVEEPLLPPTPPADTRTSTLTTKALNAPVFIPKSVATAVGVPVPPAPAPDELSLS
ncbi:hypothetical protein BDZ94DRAFT_1183770, partial [Collybia nuda]